jgi:serine/threonine protein kinase
MRSFRIVKASIFLSALYWGHIISLKFRSFNKSVDVYAFGILMWEILSQEIPFKMLDIGEIRRRVISGERPRMQTFGSSKLTAVITSSW